MTRWKFCPWCGTEVDKNFTVRIEDTRILKHVKTDDRKAYGTLNLVVEMNSNDDEHYKNIEVECLGCHVRWTAKLSEPWEHAEFQYVEIKDEL